MVFSCSYVLFYPLIAHLLYLNPHLLYLTPHSLYLSPNLLYLSLMRFVSLWQLFLPLLSCFGDPLFQLDAAVTKG